MGEAQKSSGPSGPDALGKNIDAAIKALQSAKTTLEKDTFYIKKQLETISTMIDNLVTQAAPIAERAQKAGDVVGNVKKFNDDLKKTSDRLKDLSKSASSFRGSGDTKQKDFSGITVDVDSLTQYTLKEPAAS